MGDIGATQSRLAAYSVGHGSLQLDRQETYPSAAHASLAAVLKTFLESEPDKFEAVCLGLPGPIHSDVVFPLPNLPWQVDRSEILRIVGTERVALINDVEASAAAIPELSPADLICLQPGQADAAGNRVVVSVGTGLGVSVLTPDGLTFATEAGHASFSPQQDPDFELNAALQREYGHVSWERVASGTALPGIHEFFAGKGSPRLTGPEILRRSTIDPACRKTIDIFRRYVGTVAGNVALTLMASGGIYLRGGAATKVIDKENARLFLDAFRAKGRMRSLLERIPVFVVREDNLALRGAAKHAIAMFESC